MILVSIVFGLRFFFFWVLIMVILGLIGSFTEKVEQRIELMMEPMNASVSDFARLINFTKSESDGILVGYSWCNDHGVCLPLQVLSDYMPLLIEKILGFGGAVFILITLTGIFGYIAVKSFYIFLTGEKGNRLPSILIFYMSCSSIIQIILSTFGNWRLIPLSGISLPFMSIGFTAMILPCLTYGLFVGMNMTIKNRLFQMIYSKVLVNRFLIVLVLCTFILLSTILVSRSLQTEEFASDSYIPKEKVERVSVLIKEWSMRNASLDHKVNIQDKSTTNSKALIHFIDQFSCNQRIKNIIYTSSIKTLKKYSSITKENLLSPYVDIIIHSLKVNV